MALDEFTLISRFFNRGTQPDLLLQKGIGDDCAVITPALDEDLLFTTDTLNSGVHFFPDVDPFDLGHKVLAVSLSDIAAMGGNPKWFLLSLTLPEIQTDWIEKFTKGLFQLADRYQVQLIGGDTTKGLLAVSTQVIGTVPKGEAIYRSGAKVGDDVYVTGNLGDAALGLRYRQQEVLLSTSEIQTAMTKLNRPEPRILEGLKLRHLATAMIDISDGLAADLNHILELSHVGGTLNLESIPISDSLKKSFPGSSAAEFAISQGDDYELCFTAKSSNREAIQKINLSLNGCIQRIGSIDQNLGLRLFYQNKAVTLSRKGYQHF